MLIAFLAPRVQLAVVQLSARTAMLTVSSWFYCDGQASADAQSAPEASKVAAQARQICYRDGRDTRKQGGATRLLNRLLAEATHQK